MSLTEWLHHLLNPHCPHCSEAKEAASICQSCETLKMQLEIANYDKRQMLETILSFTKPVVQETPRYQEIEPIKPKTVPWAVKKQMLEAEDRAAARIIKEREAAIAELEKETGVADAS